MVQSETTILRTLVSIAQQQGPDAMPAFQSLVSAHQYRGLYDMFRRYVPVGAKVLDWGVGNAHFSYFLVQSGYRAAGFSLEPCTLPAWLPQDGYRFVQGSFDDPVHLPFPDESFDVVASIGVLEHVRETGGDELKSLEEIRRVVQPGGLFLCYHLPNQYSAIEAMNRWVLTHRHHHAYRFTRDRIRRLLEASGARARRGASLRIPSAQHLARRPGPAPKQARDGARVGCHRRRVREGPRSAVPELRRGRQTSCHS